MYIYKVIGFPSGQLDNTFSALCLCGLRGCPNAIFNLDTHLDNFNERIIFNLWLK